MNNFCLGPEGAADMKLPHATRVNRGRIRLLYPGRGRGVLQREAGPSDNTGMRKKNAARDTSIPKIGTPARHSPHHRGAREHQSFPADLVNLR